LKELRPKNLNRIVAQSSHRTTVLGEGGRKGVKKVLVKAGEHVQASEVELSADELKEPLATDSAMSWSK
jgi:hypothetical protein